MLSSVTNESKLNFNQREKCEDKAGPYECNNYKIEGRCEYDVEVKYIFCRKTCGACHGKKNSFMTFEDNENDKFCL